MYDGAKTRILSLNEEFRSGGDVQCIRVVQDMYKGSVSTVRYAVGMTDWFQVKLGLHQ